VSDFLRTREEEMSEANGTIESEMSGALFTDRVLDSFLTYLKEVFVDQMEYGTEVSDQAKKFLWMISFMPRYQCYTYLTRQLCPYETRDRANDFVNEFAGLLKMDHTILKEPHRNKIVRFVEYFIFELVEKMREEKPTYEKTTQGNSGFPGGIPR
jgi:hypothetical protein